MARTGTARIAGVLSLSHRSSALRLASLLAPLALAAACGGDKGEGDEGSAGDDGGATVCSADLASTFPLDGASDFFYSYTMEFKFSGEAAAEEAAAASVTVTGAAGDVAGTTSVEGATLYFTPSAPLAAAAQYTATVSFCEATDEPKAPSISFSTGPLGDVVADPASLEGRTYTVALSQARFVKPEGVADLLLGQLTSDILIGVTATEGTSLKMGGALSTVIGGPQDFCNPSIDFPEAADFSDNPLFQVGPADVIIAAAGFDIPINSLMISGAFASDGSYFGGGILAGQLDARSLAPLVAELLGSDDPDEICVLLQSFSVSCNACDSDGAVYCVDVYVDSIRADEKADTVLECVDEQDCHPSCEANVCADPTAGYCD
jgi:hypothetical protein